MYLAAALAAASVFGLTGAAAADESGSISGRLWFDRNQNQVRDTGEPGRTENGVVLLYRDGVLAGAYNTDEEGRYALTGLAAGAYRVTYAGADRYLATTPSTVDITLAAGEQAGADFGVKGASISGSPWLDRDFDGLRDADEPDLDPFSVSNPTYVTGPVFRWSEQDERGRYRVDDLPAGDGYVVHVIGPDGLALTKEGGDSDVDWITGESAPLTLAPGEDVAGVDAGYAQVTGDTATTAATIDPNRRRFHVGEQFTVTLTLTNKGPVPDGINMTMNWPAGLELVDADGLTTVFTTNGLIGNSTARQLEPGESLTFTVVLKATAPITNGTIVATTYPGEYGDGNSHNDARKFVIRVVR
jgi:hypothetical protein